MASSADLSWLRPRAAVCVVRNATGLTEHVTPEPNEAFALTSFLNGVNAAYIEEMQAQYERNPGSVSDQWRLFFQSLQEEQAAARRRWRRNGGPSWGRPLRMQATGELVAALTGDYGASERSVRDKISQRAQRERLRVSPAASLPRQRRTASAR